MEGRIQLFIAWLNWLKPFAIVAASALVAGIVIGALL